MLQWDSFQECKYVPMKASINIIHHINISKKKNIIAAIVNTIFFAKIKKTNIIKSK